MWACNCEGGWVWICVHIFPHSPLWAVMVVGDQHPYKNDYSHLLCPQHFFDLCTSESPSVPFSLFCWTSWSAELNLMTLGAHESHWRSSVNPALDITTQRAGHLYCKSKHALCATKLKGEKYWRNHCLFSMKLSFKMLFCLSHQPRRKLGVL